VERKVEVAIVVCDICGKEALPADAPHWFRIFQARSEQLIDKPSRLDFDKVKCLLKFLNGDIKVSFRNNDPMLDDPRSNPIGLVQWFKTYADHASVLAALSEEVPIGSNEGTTASD
jgi:hypothetical protein